jgi:hypothetical protein
MSLAPEGRPFPADSGDLGDLLSEEEVELAVAPDGRVTECRPIRRWDGISEDRPFALGLCSAFGDRESSFVPAPSGEEVRRARLRFGYFVKVARPAHAQDN